MTQFITISIDEELKSNRELKKSDIDELKEWCKTQSHLPQISDTELVLFHHASYYQVNLTKTLIDSNLTLRTQIPEFFADRDPLNNENFRKIFHVISTIPLKQLSNEGYHVMLVRILDPDASKFDHNDSTKFVGLALDTLLYSIGPMKGVVLLFDVQNLCMGHVPRISLTSVKKCLNFMQTAIAIRLKGFYIINANMAVKLILRMIKPFMSKELADLIQIYSSLEDLDKVIPVEALPKELGGKVGTVMELQEAEIKKFESNRNWIANQDSRLRVDESKRPKK